MPYDTIADLPDAVRHAIPAPVGQRQFLAVFNAQKARGLSEERAFASSWAALRNAGYRKGKDGLWHKPETRTTETLREANTSVMVALSLSPELAASVAVPGGEAPETLHVTLAYLGDVSDLSPEALTRLPEVVQAFSVLAYPLEGEVSGVGRFLGDRLEPSPDVFYLTLDLPALPEWRQDLIDTLEAQGLPCRHDHGYTPHVTLAYLDPVTPSPSMTLEPSSVRFASVHLIMGDEHRVYALRGTDGRMAEAWPTGQLRLAPGRTDLAYAVLLQPGDGEYSREAIATGAHAWYARMPLQEQTITGRDDMRVVESFLAPSGCELAGSPVAEGSWVIAVSLVEGTALLAQLAQGTEDLRVMLEGTAWVDGHVGVGSAS